MKKMVKEVKLEHGKAPECPQCGQQARFSYFGGRCDIVCPSHGVIGDLPSPYSDTARLNIKR
jgi:hypothetical protein